jgi:predicted aminopeptidase
VQELYESAPPGTERDAARRRYAGETRAEIATPHAERLQLNDACLALAATYASDIPRYAEKLKALGGDLAAFVARLRELADADDPREALLAP